MKIVVIGGGPGGLYAALLLKKADPRREISVVERNPADATYGWGVVFSDETLHSLEEADGESFRALTERFARWDTIEVRHRGEILRVGGNVFAGMSRKELLAILQRRCADVGVTMTFRHELRDPMALPEADLIVAADGANSAIRRAWAEAFRPTYIRHPRKYVWLGTDWCPDAFVFICRESRWGLFQGTVYPHEEGTSTFVVEVDEEPWRQAGLETATEAETIEFCQALFAEDLGRHRLMSNRSEWISFVTVKNATWHHGNIVLLGDAAHTAHYTIGSGTKLAMEDAIGLAQALDRHRHVDSALTYYEQGREPIVQRIQEAALESYAWYEALPRYAGFEPVQFAFAFFTRSGRITYDNLRLRDPGFVDRVDRWFAARGQGVGRPILVAPPPMFTPLRLRGLTLLNRAVLAARPVGGAAEGVPGDAHRDALVQRAAGGAGLVVTDLVAVAADGRVTPDDAGLWDRTHLAEWKAVVDRIHADTLVRVAVRLGHAGRRGATRPRWEGLDRPLRGGAWPLLAPSPLPYAPGSAVPHAMSRADMERVREQFAHAARMAAEAGFDVLHLDLAHGYLLASFLSPLSNARSDEYGGALRHRMRFPLEVVAAVRAEWPEERPLTACLTVSDAARGGLELADGIAVALALRDLGCDAIEVAVGHTTPFAHPAYGRHFLTPFSDAIRNTVGVATITRGGITSGDAVNTIVAAGRADLCILDVEPAGVEQSGRRR